MSPLHALHLLTVVTPLRYPTFHRTPNEDMINERVAALRNEDSARVSGVS